MQNMYSLSHDLTPHSLRNSSRVKKQSIQTQDAIRWGRPRVKTLPAFHQFKGRFDMTTIQRFKLMAN